MAKNATMLSSTKAIHRNARISRCGMTSAHLTSHSQRFSPRSSDPSTRTGYAVVLINVTTPVPSLLLRASYGVGPVVRVVRSEYVGLVPPRPPAGQPRVEGPCRQVRRPLSGYGGARWGGGDERT